MTERRTVAGLLKEADAIRNYWLEPASRAIEPQTLSVTDLGGRVLDTVPYSERAGLELKLTPTSRTGVLADFGREVGGYPSVRFGAGRLGRVGAQAVEARAHILNPMVAEAAHLADPFVYYGHFKASAEASWDMPHFGGFRYLWLYPQRVGRITLRDVTLKYTPHVADRDACGSFLCDDEMLNEIWYAGMHTAQLCTIDPGLGGTDGRRSLGDGAWLLVDGARRDRLVWSADLAPAAVALYASFYETDAVRDSLLSLAGYQERTGYIPACTPGPAPARVAGRLFGDYVAWWVVTAYQYYLHTGDVEFVREMFPTIKRAMSYLHGQSRGGLFRQTPQNMWEWCYTVMRLGKPSYTNVMYYWALNNAAAMANDVAEEEVSVGFVSRAFRLGEAIERELFDERKGVLLDTTLDERRVPQDANSLAIISGLITDMEAAGKVLAYVRDRMWVEFGSTNVDVPYYRLTPGLQPHNKRVVPFMNNYEALARFAAGDSEGALELIRRCWGNMLLQEPGRTFWEWVGRDGTADNHFCSLCHSWSAGVVGLLTKYVLGIRSRGPGYRTFVFDPKPCGLEWVEGKVPVPGGFIEARVERKKDGTYAKRFKAPRGVELAHR